MARVGLISDTHGLLRPEAVAFLRGCDHIVHGGDVGREEVLLQLAGIASLTAVRGNNDMGAWAEALAETELVEVCGVSIYALHDLALLEIDPSAAGVQVVVFGHSHNPVVEHRDGVVYVNPGSAGPRRFRLPISVAEIVIADGSLSARVVELNVGRAG